MNQLLIELDDEVAAKLERLTLGRARMRSEFIRNAIRSAIWDLEEKTTAAAYARNPDSAADVYVDASVWEGSQPFHRNRARL